MIRLIKNELYKLFHKKSTFITLFILVLFVILTNFIYKSIDDYESGDYYTNNSEYVKILKEEIDNFGPINEINASDYANLQSNYETENFYLQDKNTWKSNVYRDTIAMQVYDYYNLLYVTKNKNEAEKLRQQIDSDLARLESENWEYFVQKRIEDINTNLKNYEEYPSSEETEKEIAILKYRKSLLEYRLEEHISYEDGYLNTAIMALDNGVYDKVNYDFAKTEQEKSSYENTYANFKENEYILKEKVNTNNNSSNYGIIKEFFSEYLFLILVFVIMISGAIMSDEFSKGTIKSLLTLPFKRGQILIAKLITSVLMIFFVTGFLFLIQLIVGSLVLGTGSLGTPVIGYNFSLGVVETMSICKYFLLNFLCMLPMLILLVTLAFTLSVLISSTAFSITITFCGYIASDIINAFARMYNLKFLNYFVTTNWNLTPFLFGGKSSFNIKMEQSIIICLLYFIIMFIVALLFFRKKNIKNI